MKMLMSVRKQTPVSVVGVTTMMGTTAVTVQGQDIKVRVVSLE